MTTIGKARQLKEQLEDELLDLIVQYEKDTGLVVNSVVVGRSYSFTGSNIEELDCKVEL